MYYLSWYCHFYCHCKKCFRPCVVMASCKSTYSYTEKKIKQKWLKHWYSSCYTVETLNILTFTNWPNSLLFKCLAVTYISDPSESTKNKLKRKDYCYEWLFNPDLQTFLCTKTQTFPHCSSSVHLLSFNGQNLADSGLILCWFCCSAKRSLRWSHWMTAVRCSWCCVVQRVWYV